MTSRKEQLKAEMTSCREKTLWLLSQVPEEVLRKRVHSFYSPIGWHFGHVARTEEYWIICQALGRPCLDEHYTFLFADLPENPKDNRVHLPSREEIVAYLEKVRDAVFEAMDDADFDSDDPFLADGYGWEFALQHECQHQETICELMQLIQLAGFCHPDGGGISHEAGSGEGRNTSRTPNEHFSFQIQNGASDAPSPRSLPAPIPLPRRAEGIAHSSDNNAKEFRTPHPLAPSPLTNHRGEGEFVAIPSGSFVMGSDDRHGYDNEKRAHEVRVEAFEIGRTLVTAGQWLEFMADGGYQNRDLWTEDGWAWRVREGATMPEYWVEGYFYIGPHGLREIHPEEPVSCVSWFEANAYARWAGLRLPTEAEWEYAARGAKNESLYPWGSDSPEGRACYAMTSWGPEPVGRYAEGASPFGVLDMAGNVWEWTSTPFLPYLGFQAFPYDGYSKDHMKGLHKVCRGGSWATSAKILRSSFRNWYVPTYRQGFLGLRLAR